MGDSFRCYFCDVATKKQNAKIIFDVKSDHSKRPISVILKRLQNGDETICSRDGMNTCMLCSDCIDKINAYDAACLLVKQVEKELKAIISRTAKRYKTGKDPIEITNSERMKTILESQVTSLQPYGSNDVPFNFNFEGGGDILEASEPEAVTESEEEEYDSDDSFVWPKKYVSKRRRVTNVVERKRKRRLYKCIECPADYRDKNDMQVICL